MLYLELIEKAKTLKDRIDVSKTQDELDYLNKLEKEI